MPRELTLFTGPSCSLCEDAKELIYPYLGAGFTLQEIDVTKTLETKKTYGLRIPVLYIEENGQELAWPFNAEMLGHFLSNL